MGSSGGKGLDGTSLQMAAGTELGHCALTFPPSFLKTESLSCSCKTAVTTGDAGPF